MTLAQTAQHADDLAFLGADRLVFMAEALAHADIENTQIDAYRDVLRNIIVALNQALADAYLSGDASAVTTLRASAINLMKKLDNYQARLGEQKTPAAADRSVDAKNPAAIPFASKGAMPTDIRDLKTPRQGAQMFERQMQTRIDTIRSPNVRHSLTTSLHHLQRANLSGTSGKMVRVRSMNVRNDNRMPSAVLRTNLRTRMSADTQFNPAPNGTRPTPLRSPTAHADRTALRTATRTGTQAIADKTGKIAGLSSVRAATTDTMATRATQLRSPNARIVGTTLRAATYTGVKSVTDRTGKTVGTTVRRATTTNATVAGKTVIPAANRTAAANTTKRTTQAIKSSTLASPADHRTLRTPPTGTDRTAAQNPARIGLQSAANTTGKSPETPAVRTAAPNAAITGKIAGTPIARAATTDTMATRTAQLRSPAIRTEGAAVSPITGMAPLSIVDRAERISGTATARTTSTTTTMAGKTATTPTGRTARASTVPAAATHSTPLRSPVARSEATAASAATRMGPPSAVDRTVKIATTPVARNGDTAHLTQLHSSTAHAERTALRAATQTGAQSVVDKAGKIAGVPVTRAASPTAAITGKVATAPTGRIAPVTTMTPATQAVKPNMPASLADYRTLRAASATNAVTARHEMRAPATPTSSISVPTSPALFSARPTSAAPNVSNGISGATEMARTTHTASATGTMAMRQETRPSVAPASSPASSAFSTTSSMRPTSASPNVSNGISGTVEAMRGASASTANIAMPVAPPPPPQASTPQAQAPSAGQPAIMIADHTLPTPDRSFSGSGPTVAAPPITTPVVPDAAYNQNIAPPVMFPPAIQPANGGTESGPTVIMPPTTVSAVPDTAHSQNVAQPVAPPPTGAVEVVPTQVAANPAQGQPAGAQAADIGGQQQQASADGVREAPAGEARQESIREATPQENLRDDSNKNGNDNKKATIGDQIRAEVNSFVNRVGDSIKSLMTKVAKTVCEQCGKCTDGSGCRTDFKSNGATVVSVKGHELYNSADTTLADKKTTLDAQRAEARARAAATPKTQSAPKAQL